jgi:hypothetical protein
VTFSIPGPGIDSGELGVRPLLYTWYSRTSHRFLSLINKELLGIINLKQGDASRVSNPTGARLSENGKKSSNIALES